MSKYKKAIKAELEWLEKDILIVDNIMTGREDNINNLTHKELRARLKYATNEIARLRYWLERYDKR